MKKFLLILLTITFLSSCKKDDENIYPEPQCNCGFITDDGIDIINGNFNYWIEIRNNCTSNVKRFYLTEGDWLNANPGEDICISNSGQWIIDPNNTHSQLKLSKLNTYI
jgi:hypothetical protein